MRGRLIIICTLIFTAAFGHTLAGETANRVTLDGQGILTAPANQVVVTFTIRSEAKSLDTAFARAHSQLSAIEAALVKLGLEKGALRSSFYDNADKKKKQSGFLSPSKKYKLVQSAQITTGKTDLVEPILSLLTAFEVDQIVKVGFELVDQESFKKQAVALAVADARAKALAMTEELGIELGEVIEIQERGVPRFRQVSVPTPVPIKREGRPPAPPITPEYSIATMVKVVYAVNDEPSAPGAINK